MALTIRISMLACLTFVAEAIRYQQAVHRPAEDDTAMAIPECDKTIIEISDGAESDLQQSVRRHVQAYFDLVESELPEVDYTRVPKCVQDEANTNLVVRVRNRSWSLVCGNVTVDSVRGPPLLEILDRVVPKLAPEVDVYLPFCLHDSIPLRRSQGPQDPMYQVMPILGTLYAQSPPGASAGVPFAMACMRAKGMNSFANTPVVGWDNHMKQHFSCPSQKTSIRKAVFRGKAGERRWKYGSCTNACSWKDNGRLLVHSLGQTRPDLFDASCSNADSFNMTLEGPSTRTNDNRAYRSWAEDVEEENEEEGSADSVTLPEQVCNYTAVLNIGNNVDWAERLRQLFFGNAVVMVPGPENMPHEFFTSWLKPYVNYWPIKPDLSDIEEQVAAVLDAARAGDKKITEVLAGQKAFRETFLSESFMLSYDAVVIEEFYRRRVLGFQSKPKVNGELVAAGRHLLNAVPCTMHMRECISSH